MITANPDGVLNDFIYFCDAVASWDNPEESLKNKFTEVKFIFPKLNIKIQSK